MVRGGAARAFELGEGDGEIGALPPLGSSWPDRLLPGQELHVNQWLVSQSGQFGFVLQEDGNVVLYRLDTGQAYWDLGTTGLGGVRLIMQRDANLVLYDRAMNSLWSSTTPGRGAGAFAVMQDDANFVVYAGPAPIWWSDTVGAQRHDDSGGFFSDLVDTFVTVVKDVAPFAQAALSFVPGVGTVINAAVAAGVSLAQGKNITDALISSTIAALPGGPIVQAAAKAGIAIVKGENVGTAALNAARDALPGGQAAKAAFDIAVSLTVGQQVQQGYIAPVAANDNSIVVKPAAPAAPLAHVGIIQKKAEAGTLTFSQLANAPLIDLVPTQKAIEARAAAKRKKFAIAAVSVAGAGAAGYYAWPWLSTLKVVRTVAGLVPPRRR